MITRPSSASVPIPIIDDDPELLAQLHYKILANDGAAGDVLGFSVAVDGNTALIGALEDDDAGADSGSAYVYVRDAQGNWDLQAKLLPGDGTAGDHFGHSVSLDGDTALIGAHDDDAGGAQAGSAYVFVRDRSGNWSEQAKLLPGDLVQGVISLASRFPSMVIRHWSVRQPMTIRGLILARPMSSCAMGWVTGASRPSCWLSMGMAGDVFGTERVRRG